MENLGDIVVFGVPGAVIIVALIELAKHYGLPVRWAPLIALILGVGLSIGVYYAGINAQVAIWLKLVLGGILCGLAAVGGFSGTRSMIDTVAKTLLVK
ncbi:MAG: hypothetical protein ACYC6L_02670 [Anaerolineae bacterium]